VYLSQIGVPFSERNLSEDATALEELRELKVMSVPVTCIGEAVIMGFDRGKIDQALA
jgi:glutaredoxin